MARTVGGSRRSPPARGGETRARGGEEGFVRRAMRARTSLDPAAPSEESTAWSRTRRISGDASASSPVGGMGWFRFRVTSHPRASGCCFLARPSVATAGGVDRGDRRDRRDPFGGRNPVDRASPGYLPRRTAGERVAGRGAPPGEFGNRALRAENDRFRLGPVSVASLVLSFLSIGLSRQMARTPSARRSGPVVREGSRGKSRRHTTGLSRSSAAAGPRADRAPRGGRGGARFDDAERGRRWRASDTSRGRGRRGAGVVDARDGVARAEARGGS